MASEERPAGSTAAEELSEQWKAAQEEMEKRKHDATVKSNVIFHLKPWGDDTDMEAMEKAVRTIEMEGLLWGRAKLEPIGYGINRLVISSVVEDEKVSLEDLEQKIWEFEDYIQSVDIAAIHKVNTFGTS